MDEMVMHTSRHTQRRRGEGPPEDINMVKPEVTMEEIMHPAGKDGGAPAERMPPQSSA